MCKHVKLSINKRKTENTNNMKILQLLESVMGLNDDTPQYKLSNVNAFSEVDGMIDGSFSFVQDNGVVYAVDIMVNPKTRGFKLGSIDVQDHGRTYAGDHEDIKTVMRFFKDHFADIVTQLQQDLEDNVDGNKPFNMPAK